MKRRTPKAARRPGTRSAASSRTASRPRRETAELARIARFLTETLDITTVGRRVVDSVCKLFEVPGAGLRLREADGALVLVAAAGDGPYMPIGHRAPTDFGIYRLIIESGFYQAPTLLRDVPVDARIACDEVFGPVLAAMPFDDEAHAVALANGTDYGLVAGVWTRDGARQLRMARAVQSGQVFVNNYGAGGGVELPFGGVKHSGHGREKGFEALYGFTTLKTVVLRHG